ncbi:MAG TPA: SAM-dependent methyltransferase [Prevotella sp.]|nr:SAM-dependent methyltransferase [Candidatus Segatella violae]
MINQATLDFIRQHQDDDVRKLAFLGSKYPDVDMPFALDQIRGRKMARVKLPRWAEIDGIIYPPHISMEQCSSEQTAQYKAELAARLLGLGVLTSADAEKSKDADNSKICEFAGEREVASKFARNEDTSEKQQILTNAVDNVNEIKEETSEGSFSDEIEFVDLTGGFGVDFSYIAARLGVKSMYVERQAHLCETAKENFERLGLKNAIVKNGDGVEVLHTITSDQTRSLLKTSHRLKLIFIDPARRDDAGNKVVSLQDCTPDVTQLQDEMLAKADYVIIKLSPMLDWHRAVSELSHVREVHIVSVNNECKELLLVLSAQEEAPLRVFCVNDDQHFGFYDSHEAAVSIVKADEVDGYLYEPNASLMKAGCFGDICQHYGVKMLAKNSHLFSSQELVADFPGRTFRINTISSFNKKELKRQLAGIVKANVAIRNFPLSVPELRKRLKLKDGGDNYIFATTLSDESHVLIIGTK